MKNNLLKSVAAAATASALLFSTVTSFAAATATTVTTYKSGSKVGVTSIITGAPAGKMITYLASSGKDGAVNTSTDIKYIGQKTVPTDGNVSFSYDIDDATVGKTVATVRYGSDDAATATALNEDAAKEIVCGALTITKNNCTVKINDVAVTDDNASTFTIGNGENLTVNIEADAGYEVKEVYVNGESRTLVEQATSITYNSTGTELAVICGAVSNESRPRVVGVRSYAEADKKMVGLLCSKSAPTGSTVTFGVVAEKTNGEEYVMDNRKEGNFYAATVGDGSYYAVELFSNEDGLKLIPAYKDGQTIHVFADSSTVEYTK